MGFSVVLICLGKEMIVDLCDSEEEMSSMTVLQLKEKIESNANINRGRYITLENSTPLSKYRIQNSSVIHLVLRVHGG
uniref:Ubiquitin-like domain-containing protein n=1 Tax=Anabas testudineus TaxID=64144 RepID=A0A3Q1H490_ANATE